MQRIFGLDIGTTSIGFAVIDFDKEREAGEILRLGVRIFPEARDADGTPLNQQRRQKRQLRRQIRRRRQRRRLLNEILSAAGLLPSFGSPEWPIVMKADPYALRARALAEAVTPHELGRALYHLAHRRHFKGRELEEADSEAAAEEVETKDERELLSKALEREKTTLGAWLAKRGPHERKRGVHAHRSNVEAEFEALWSAQAEHHPALQDPEFKARIKDVVFLQRPVFWRKNTLGDCRFIPGATLCPRGTWLSQQRRMLEKLNNLAVAGGNARPLDAEERAAILERLQSQASMSWGGVREALKPLFKKRGEPGAQKRLKFNLELGGDTKLPGNLVEAKLVGIFGDSWARHPHKQALRDAVHERLWNADYGEVGSQRVVILSPAERATQRAAAVQSFIDDFGVSPDQAAALRELSFPSGWEPYSTQALRAFLPHLEAGVRFGALVNGPDWEDWRNATFPNRLRPTGEVLDHLPSPADREEQERLAKVRNPTVVRVQNELRKVVNNLISLYGKPDRIRIELAREVGKSKREREEMQAGIQKRERLRKRAAEALQANGIAQPSRDTIEKWLLWKESQERCPYTGDQIGFDALFREDRYEVEHIWPRSRSLDNSFRNKTLCRKDVNIAKGNRTPFECFRSDAETWDAIKRRLEGMTAIKGGPGLPPGKVKRFLAEALPEDFAERQLRDTSYAAREILAQLKRLWPDIGERSEVKVEPVTGRVTAQLRKLWTLNNVLDADGEKTRADHRHHAIDALTVACTDLGMTNRLSRYWQAIEDPTVTKPHLPLPWPTIRSDAEDAAAKIVVSHRVRKKVSGPLHQEMPLGYTGKDIVKNGNTLGIYVKRLPVEKLSLETLRISRVEDISRSAKFVVRDDQIRKILINHLARTNAKPEKSYPPYPRIGSTGPEIRKVRVLTTQQKKLMVSYSTGFVDPANNHHIAIYRDANGKTLFKVITLHQAAWRLANREPVIQRHPSDGSTFVASLSPGDAIEFRDGETVSIRIVQSVWASGVIVTLEHTDAVGTSVWRPAASSFVNGSARKIAIDPIGRIRIAND